jgi:Na+-transporting methylmalonyl-CoA/oxaloacetate decarboxylase gamma subunit
MKIKRLITKKCVLVVSTLAVMFALTGCDNEVAKPFDYDNQEIVVSTMSSFEQYSAVSSEYADYYINGDDEFAASAVKGIDQAVSTDKVGEFEDYSTYIDGGELVPKNVYTITNADDSVSVTIINKAENRDVEITVKYVENPEYYIQYDQYLSEMSVDDLREQLEYYGWSEEDYIEQMGYSSLEDAVEEAKQYIPDELAADGVYPYTAEEMVVNAVYSKGELMAQAGRNTLIGMGTVFVVLIFISFIISLFKYLPALFAKKPKVEAEKKPETKPVPASEAKTVVLSSPTVKLSGPEGNLMDDEELVAVITAAVYAASASEGGAVSRDKLIVRSIKRARR